MTFKYILQELYQWFAYKMKEKKARCKFAAVIVVGVLVLMAVYVANGVITQKQSGSSTTHGPSTSQAVSTSNTQNESTQDQGPNATETQQPTLLLSAIIISSVLGIAIITSTGMYLYYRKKHMDCIVPLPVLYSEEARK